MGPLANDRRIPAIESLIADAVDRGGRLLAGGRRIGNEGNFFEPTVLADVPASARIMNEEPFGPVAIVNRFASFAEANRLPFALAAYAFYAAHGDGDPGLARGRGWNAVDQRQFRRARA